MTESEPPQGATGYSAAGVDYETLDAGKRLAIAGALSTSALIEGRGGHALDASRGEPAFVFELDGRTLAFVVEGLGTKSVIARQVLEAQGVNRFGDVAYDTVAAILNDLCCVGALPLVVNAYFATGASEWYREGERGAALIEGWRKACVDADCTWGGGESPTLPGLLDEREIELAGAAVGAVPEGRRALLGEELEPGDEIVLVASSGLHANGASLARLLAGRLPDGYATELAADRTSSDLHSSTSTIATTPPSIAGATTLGEALLEPSVMYVGLVAALLAEELPLHYISHITGHGLLKLMRPTRALTYRIERLPPVPAVLSFLVQQARLDAHAAYSTFNMGSGYALYCAPGTGEAIVVTAERLGLSALVAGQVEDGPRQVILEPVGVHFVDEELELA
jgi:phosphoribosylformylglycinamidine cyclo-ligase